eukprot:1775113-Pleurochrysis_carterae.AAC.1
MLVGCGVGVAKCVQQSEPAEGALTVRLCRGARRGATNGVCIVSVRTESNAKADVLCDIGGAAARLSGESGEKGGMRGKDARAASATASAAGWWAADADACAYVLCGVDSTDERDVCVDGTGLCIDQTRHKMQTNLRAAPCRVINARVRVKSVAERTCAGRWPDNMLFVSCAVERDAVRTNETNVVCSDCAAIVYTVLNVCMTCARRNGVICGSSNVHVCATCETHTCNGCATQRRRLVTDATSAFAVRRAARIVHVRMPATVVQ